MWTSVTRQQPCVICGRTSWCTRTTDGNACKCMKVPSPHVIQHKGGEIGWFYLLNEPLPPVKYVPNPKPIAVNLYRPAMEMAWSFDSWQTRDQLAQALGVKEPALEVLDVGAGWDAFRQEVFSSWPERLPNGKVAGIMRRYASGEKLTLSGSRHGLYFQEEWDTGFGPLIVPEGGSDTAALISLGLTTIGRYSNTGGGAYISQMIQGFKRPILVLGENDRREDERCHPCPGCFLCWPGKFGAIATAKLIHQQTGKQTYWSMLPSKDVREWMQTTVLPTREQLLEDARQDAVRV